MWPATRPRTDPELLELFHRSGRNAGRATVLLRDLLADYPDGTELAREILVCERTGDRIAHEILSRIAERGRSCALEPADVGALTAALDDIVDYAEEAADQLVLYGVEAPMEQAQHLAEVLVSAAGGVMTALTELRDGGTRSATLAAIHRVENEADRLVRRAVASLFANGIDPMTVIRWKDIYETLESAVDACATAANVLEGIALKHAAARR